MMESETQALTVPQSDSGDNDPPFSPLSRGGQISSVGLTYVTIDVGESMAKLFTPHTKGMYQQFATDPDCDQLIHGYFRRTFPIQILPKGVDQVIAAYYRQPYARTLRGKLARIRMLVIFVFAVHSLHVLCQFVECTTGPIKEKIDILNRKSSSNKKSWFLLFVLWLILIVKDIAMLIVNFRDDCTLNTESGQYSAIDLNTWMVVASVLEIYMISGCMFPCFASKWRRSSIYKEQRKKVLQNGKLFTRYEASKDIRTQWYTNACLCYWTAISVLLIWFVLMFWAVLGFLLLYHDGGSIDNGPCKDMVEAWIWMDVIMILTALCLLLIRAIFYN